MVVDIWKAIVISTSHYEFAGCPVPLCAMIFYSRVASSRKFRSSMYHSPSRISQVSILEHSISLRDMDIRVQELQVPDPWVLVSKICRFLSQDQYANWPPLHGISSSCSPHSPLQQSRPLVQHSPQPKSHSVPSLGHTHKGSTPKFHPTRHPPLHSPFPISPPQSSF
jgi:hypothetical protein